jgi:site-specific DNA recombinase
VSSDQWQRVNARIKDVPVASARRPRSEPGTYVLAGVMRCGHCGKAMFGATLKGKPYYRCVATRPDYGAPSVEGHPPTYSVREERVLASLDDWLNGLIEPDTVEGTVASIVTSDVEETAEPAAVARARRDLARLGVELDRVLAAIRAGMDPALGAGETRRIQHQQAVAAETIDLWSDSRPPRPLTHAEVRDALTTAEGIVGLLADADRADRADLYRALGLCLEYVRGDTRKDERVRAKLQLRSGGGGI